MDYTIDVVTQGEYERHQEGLWQGTHAPGIALTVHWSVFSTHSLCQPLCSPSSQPPSLSLSPRPPSLPPPPQPEDNKTETPHAALMPVQDIGTQM